MKFHVLTLGILLLFACSKDSIEPSYMDVWTGSYSGTGYYWVRDGLDTDVDSGIAYVDVIRNKRNTSLDLSYELHYFNSTHVGSVYMAGLVPPPNGIINDTIQWRIEAGCDSISQLSVAFSQDSLIYNWTNKCGGAYTVGISFKASKQ